MPAGSFTIDPQADSPSRLTPPATAVHVYRYDPDAEGDAAYALLPNVYCQGVFEREGSEPTSAQFGYMTGDLESLVYGWPSQFEDLWPMQAADSPFRVKQGDRLAVLATLPDESRRLLFDGFATAPQADVSADAQEVTFAASSAEVRCWDAPIAGRFERHGDKPTSPDDADVVETGLPCRFNPDAKPNCTPDGADVVDPAGDFDHPVFIGRREDAPGDFQSFWTLAKAAKYILARCNDETYVDNPDFSVLTDLLNNRTPKDGADSYDPDDPATYDDAPVTLSDYDASNRPWPDVLAELLGYHGFAMRFMSELDDQGLPWHHLEIERRDQAGPRDPKGLLLPKATVDLDPAAVNVGAIHVATDFRDVANRIEIESGEKLYEASFVLAPGFHVDPGDATSSNAAAFLMTAASVATDEVRDKYRKYVADEIGEGHWSFPDDAWVEDEPIDLSPIFPDVDPGGGKPKTPGYVRRRRPGRNKLVTLDARKENLKKQLHFSRDYAGPEPPCVWDGTGTWQAIAGSWELLDDRLGVYVTADDVRQWKIGKDVSAAKQEDSPSLDGVTSIADPSTTVKATKRFHLRLTTAIEGDFGIEAVAERRKASPIGHPVTRRIDARDHYRYAEVEASSAAGSGNAVVVDDTDKAVEKATQLRAAHEFPPIGGSVTIPHLDFSIEVGDRIDKINGRDVSLQVNGGSEAGEAKSYPFVVARTFSMGGDEQTTVLQLSDRRNEPAPIGRRR